MTENTPTPAELVEEARNHVEHFPLSDGDALRVGRLADALEAVTAERDALVVEVEKGRRIMAGYDRTEYEKAAERDRRDAQTAYALYRAEQVEHAATGAERDALAAALEQAPHSPGCKCWFIDEDGEYMQGPPAWCDCYLLTAPATVLAQVKAAALREFAARNAELPAVIEARRVILIEADRIEWEAQR